MKETPAPEPNESPLSLILESQDPNAFLIQPPDKKKKDFLESKIYFWETSTMIKIQISSNDITKDVIRHCMTLYKQSKFEKNDPMRYTDPHRYALYMVDEYDRRNKFRADEEMGPRPMTEPIGEFKTLAFIEVKNYKPKKDGGQSGIDEQMQKELEA